MADLDFSWKLRDGFSRLLQHAELKLALSSGPARVDWAGSPWKLANRDEPVEIHFQLRRPLTGRGPGGLRWKVAPKLAVRSRILWPGHAFLGNFRVPRNRLAVEWRVEAEATADLSSGTTGWLAGAEQGSRLSFTWVAISRGDSDLRTLLRAAWSSFVDPLDPAAVARLTDRQAVRFAWRGRATLGTSIQWNVVRGWSVARSASALRWTGHLSGGANAEADVRLQHTGRWSLLVSRRRGRLRVSVQRIRESSKRARLRVSAGGTGRQTPRLAAALDPIADPVRRRLRSALRRQIGMALSLEAARARRRQRLLKASWKDPSAPRFAAQYRGVLAGGAGQASDPAAGFEFESVLETVSRRVFSVELNFFDWLSFTHRRSTETSLSVRQAPDGSVTIERSYEAQRLHRWRGSQELMSLLASHLEGERAPLVWTAAWSGPRNRDGLRRILRQALHCGVIEEIRLPAFEGRAEIEVLWRTRFSPAGIQRALRRSPNSQLAVLVRALELHSPDLYGSGSALRDWIDHRRIRELIERDPAGAHLSSRYPVPDRSYHQRVQAVAAYRRAAAFLDLLQEWAVQDFESVLAGLDRLLKVPAFLFFHLACPKRLRKSALISAGPVTIARGEQSLVDELAGAPLTVENEAP